LKRETLRFELVSLNPFNFKFNSMDGGYLKNQTDDSVVTVDSDQDPRETHFAQKLHRRHRLLDIYSNLLQVAEDSKKALPSPDSSENSILSDLEDLS